MFGNITDENELRYREDLRAEYEKGGLETFLWGCLMVITALTSELSYYMGFIDLSAWIWIITGIPFIISSLILSFKKKSTISKIKQPLGNISWVWLLGGLISLIVFFLLKDNLTQWLVTIIFAPFSFGGYMTAEALNDNLLIKTSSVGIILSILALIVPIQFHTIIMICIFLSIMVYPGFVLHKRFLSRITLS